MFSIEKLSEITGLSRRAIRYYVQTGLLSPPEGKGRGSVYTQAHADTILKIRNWSEQGYPLFKIKEMLTGAAPAEPVKIIPHLTVSECVAADLGNGITLTYPAGLIDFNRLALIQQSVYSILKGVPNETEELTDNHPE